MYCGIGECRQIPVQTEEFVQILKNNSNHLVTIYAMNCAPGELQVYNNLSRTVRKDIKELVVDTHRYDRTAIHQAPDGDAVHSQVCFSYFN